MRRARPIAASPRQQRGAVAILVGLTLLVLVGMFGLAVDAGRLYVNKSELQSAADACALAAAQELVCQPSAGVNCAASFLQNAEAAGILAGGRNRSGLQANAIAIAPADVRFHTDIGPNGSFLSRAGGANPNSRFAMCIARANGITPWVMGVMGVGASNVNALAVATLAPGRNFCSNAPIGVCSKVGGVAPSFGYAPGEWIASNFTSNGNGNNATDNLSGSFRWVDFTPNAGGNSEVRDQLYGRNQACGLQVGNNIQQPGTQQGAKAAYNTRFGIYPNGANAETPQTAPPDRTGYAYPNKAPGAPVIGIGTSAYDDYRSHQNLHTPFTSNQYGVNGPGGNFSGNPVSAADHTTYGTERRLIAAPVINCNAGNTVPMLGMACVLMLNPMSNGANGTIYLEYIGNAAAAGSPCRTFGGAGGPGSTGPLVPALVQ